MSVGVTRMNYNARDRQTGLRRVSWRMKRIAERCVEIATTVCPKLSLQRIAIVGETLSETPQCVDKGPRMSKTLR